MLHCSFCGRPQDQVMAMVFGYHGACICDECVALCAASMSPILNEPKDEDEEPHDSLYTAH